MGAASSSGAAGADAAGAPSTAAGAPTEATALVKPAAAEDEPPRSRTAAAVGSLVAVAVFKTQITAALFTTVHAPTAFSMLSCVVTCIMLVPCFLVWRSQWAVVTWSMFWPELAIVTLFTAIDLAMSNVALAELSTALFQCIAATNPAMTALIEGVYQRKRQHWAVYATLVGLVAGAVMANAGSDRSRVTTYGLVAAFLQVVCSATKYVFAHGILKKQKGKLGSLALLFWLDLFMIPIYVPYVWASGEAALVFGTARPARQWLEILVIAGIGGARALTQFVVLMYVSATSMSSANIFTQVLNILISLPAQHTAVGPLLVLGICCTVGSSAVYAYFKSSKEALARLDEQLPACAERSGAEGAKSLLAP